MCHGEELTPKPLETKIQVSVCDFALCNMGRLPCSAGHRAIVKRSDGTHANRRLPVDFKALIRPARGWGAVHSLGVRSADVDGAQTVQEANGPNELQNRQ
jgi:hypothetical protein